MIVQSTSIYDRVQYMQYIYIYLFIDWIRICESYRFSPLLVNCHQVSFVLARKPWGKDPPCLQRATLPCLRAHQCSEIPQRRVLCPHSIVVVLLQLILPEWCQLWQKMQLMCKSAWCNTPWLSLKDLTGVCSIIGFFVPPSFSENKVPSTRLVTGEPSLEPSKKLMTCCVRISWRIAKQIWGTWKAGLQNLQPICLWPLNMAILKLNLWPSHFQPAAASNQRPEGSSAPPRPPPTPKLASEGSCCLSESNLPTSTDVTDHPSFFCCRMLYGKVLAILQPTKKRLSPLSVLYSSRSNLRHSWKRQLQHATAMLTATGA